MCPRMAHREQHSRPDKSLTGRRLHVAIAFLTGRWATPGDAKPRPAPPHASPMYLFALPHSWAFQLHLFCRAIFHRPYVVAISHVWDTFQPLQDFPGGPVVKTLCSQCRGPWFDSWSGTRSHMTTKTQHRQTNKTFGFPNSSVDKESACSYMS